MLKFKTKCKQKDKPIESLLNLSLIELQLGYGLVSLVKKLCGNISCLRKRFASEFGVIVPPIRIRDNLELDCACYTIIFKGVEIARANLVLKQKLSLNPNKFKDEIDGIETEDPVYGLPCRWITKDKEKKATLDGHTVVNHETIIATHLSNVITTNLHELVGYDEMMTILFNFSETNTYLVEYIKYLIPEHLSIRIILKVVQNLLKEQIPVIDIRTILETLAEFCVETKDPFLLTEYVRKSLFRIITASIKSKKGDVAVYCLDRKIEEMIASNIVKSETGSKVCIDFQTLYSIKTSLQEKIELVANSEEKFVVLCRPIIRGHFKKMLEQFLPNLIVISYDEINQGIPIRQLGTINLPPSSETVILQLNTLPQQFTCSSEITHD